MMNSTRFDEKYFQMTMKSFWRSASKVNLRGLEKGYEELSDLKPDAINFKFPKECEKTVLTAACSACITSSVKDVELCVDFLLSKGADPNIYDSSGFTALMYAALHNRVGVAKRLCKAGARVNLPSLSNSNILAMGTKGATAVHYALHSTARRDSSEMLGVLLDSPNSRSDANLRDDSMETPLHWAVKLSDTKSVKILVEKGADVSAVGHDGKTALHFACEHCVDAEIVSCLLNQGADVTILDNSGVPALYALLARKRIMYDEYDKKFRSCKRREIAKILLDGGAQINHIDSDGQTMLFHAIRWGDPELVEILIGHQPDVTFIDRQGRSALHFAVLAGHERTLECLLKNGGRALVDHLDARGHSPLHTAVVQNRRLVETLLSFGANAGIKNWKGETPFDMFHAVKRLAVRSFDQCRSIDLLLQKGVDINQRDPRGYTLLHRTMKILDELFHENAPVDPALFTFWIDFMLSCGADLFAQDSNGKHPVQLISKLTHMQKKHIPKARDFREKLRNTMEFVAACQNDDKCRIVALCRKCMFTRVRVISTPSSGPTTEYTLLEYAIKHKLHMVVAVLIWNYAEYSVLDQAQSAAGKPIENFNFGIVGLVHNWRHGLSQRS